MEPSSQQIDVFISYSWSHQDFVRQIYNRLNQERINCWMDTSEMRPGDDLPDQIANGLSNCKLVLCCLTPQYLQSENCKKEAKLANDYKKTIIPVYLEEISKPLEGGLAFIIAGKIYVDFSKSHDQLYQWNGEKVTELMQGIWQVLSLEGRRRLRDERRFCERSSEGQNTHSEERRLREEQDLEERHGHDEQSLQTQRGPIQEGDVNAEDEGERRDGGSSTRSRGLSAHHAGEQPGRPDRRPEQGRRRAQPQLVPHVGGTGGFEEPLGVGENRRQQDPDDSQQVLPPTIGLSRGAVY